jgi:polygalacturonase
MLTRRLALALGTSTLYALFASTLSAQTLATGDSREPIPEPRYPMVCTALQAQFSSTQRATPPAADVTTFPLHLHDERDEHHGQ